MVYSNICRPIKVESIGGNKYFIAFIDDTSRKLDLSFEIQRLGILGVSIISCDGGKGDRLKVEMSPN